MSSQLAWHTARAAGLVAWALLAASVLWGLLVSIRLTRRPTARWLLDLHRFLGGLAVVFTAVHLVALVADTYVHFGVADLFVPFASGWKPAAVALGVVGFYFLVAVEGSSLLMGHLPNRWWRAIHLASYLSLLAGTLHAVTAGADARNPIFVVAVDLTLAAVLFLTLVRLFSPRTRRPPNGSRPAASQPATIAPQGGSSDESLDRRAFVRR